jgi:hypothetical protein
MSRTRQVVRRSFCMLVFLCGLPPYGFSASPVEQSILSIRDNAEAFGVYGIASATVLTQDDTNPVYLYEVTALEPMSGESSIATFCSQIRFEENTRYLLFLASTAFELESINRRLQPETEGLCIAGVVGGGDGSYMVEGSADDELVVLAAFPWGILNDDCIRNNGVEDEYSRAYAVAINFEFLKKRLLTCNSACECDDHPAAEKNEGPEHREGKK